MKNGTAVRKGERAGSSPGPWQAPGTVSGSRVPGGRCRASAGGCSRAGLFNMGVGSQKVLAVPQREQPSLSSTAGLEHSGTGGISLQLSVKSNSRSNYVPWHQEKVKVCLELAAHEGREDDTP